MRLASLFASLRSFSPQKDSSDRGEARAQASCGRSCAGVAQSRGSFFPLPVGPCPRPASLENETRTLRHYSLALQYAAHQRRLAASVDADPWPAEGVWSVTLRHGSVRAPAGAGCGAANGLTVSA